MSASVRYLAGLVGAGLALPAAVAAQTSVRVYVNAPDISNGRQNRCVVAPHKTVGAAPGALDTAYIYIVADAASPTPTLVPKHEKLRVAVGVTASKTLEDGRAADSIAIGPSGLTNAIVSVSRDEDGQPICGGLPASPRAMIELDSLTVARIRADSARLLSARAIRQIRGRSYVMLSLIKSIAGEIPQDEFFDLRLKFGGAFVERNRFEPIDCSGGPVASDTSRLVKRQGKLTLECGVKVNSYARSLFAKQRFFTAASVDVSLSTRADSTAADSSRKRLTDAGLSFNWVFAGDSGITASRMWFVNTRYKIFNTKSFLGGGLGGLELSGSRLEGTHLTLSYLYRVYNDSLRIADKVEVKQTAVAGPPPSTKIDTIRTPQFDNKPTRNHMFLEFYIRVPGAQFLDRLRIRGGVLFPLQRKRRPEARIILTVPVVDLDRF